MLCSSCGYDNPREHLYCGMCGTPLLHRPLTVHEAQSTLTFSSAPLVIAPSPLPVPAAESPQPESLAVSAPVEAVQPSPPESTPIEPPPDSIVPLPPIAEEAAPLVSAAAVPAVATPPQDEAPVTDMTPVAEVAAPETAPEVVSVEEVAAPETAPEVISVEEVAAPETAPEVISVEEVAAPETVPEVVSVEEVAAPETVPEVISVEEVAAPETAPEVISVEIPAPEPSLVQAEHTPAPDESLAPAAAVAAIRIETEPAVLPPSEAPEPTPAAAVTPPPPPTVPREEDSRPTPPLPEIRRYAPPRRKAPPTRSDAGSRKPTIVPKLPVPQPTTPPPASAGMPTFQSVAEASGAPVVSPFEPPDEKHPDEERELREFVASFRYNPPEESIDELTMRSEVPVLDAEAPVTPSHPSFDDDVPPPPEAGPHPTGEEYYPSVGASADRSRVLDITTTPGAGSAHRASTSYGSSFLGLGASSPSTAPALDELASPARRHWFFWSSLVALVAIFAVLGFFKGRAQMDHAYRGPIEVIREQYAKLRQRASEATASAPSNASDKRTPEAPAPSEPQATPSAAEKPAATVGQSQPESSANANPAATTAAPPKSMPDQQPKSPLLTKQSTPTTDNKVAATRTTPPAAVAQQKPPAETQPKPAPDATARKLELEPPPVAALPRSKSAPGQEELANAMQASDPAAAAAWLWKATSRGNPVAPVRLAEMYIKGKGVPHSCEQALVLLRSEAAKENAPARNRLAALYANGTCVARDRVKAYQLMSSALAIDPTSEWAVQNRKELWQQMTSEEHAQAEKYH